MRKLKKVLASLVFLSLVPIIALEVCMERTVLKRPSWMGPSFESAVEAFTRSLAKIVAFLINILEN